MTEPDHEDPSRLFDDHPPAEAEGQKPRQRRRWLWVLIALIVAIPIALTLAGALTSPPHVNGVPVGHLAYLDADEPSDHTAMLRGLRLMGPDGASRQILHEYEPQDIDAGSREWITQPKMSPDGKWLAFEKQLITLHEEQQAIDNQIWVVPLTGPNPQPRMLLDLTGQKLKQFVGLAWSRDSQNVLFLNDAVLYRLNAQGRGSISAKQPLPGCPPLRLTPEVSATHDPFVDAQGALTYNAATPAGSRFIGSGHETNFPSTVSVRPDGGDIALSLTGQDISRARGDHPHKAHWGWSVFGKRHITALHWSPDGKYLAYSVSKPPFEDELFYVDLATGKCFQLPVRTGRAGWDWGL